MKVPEEFSYSEDHEWTSVDGGKVRIGITDYAQDALGDVVFVELPGVGADVDRGTTFGEVESTKSVLHTLAAACGVTLTNDQTDKEILSMRDKKMLIKVVEEGGFPRMIQPALIVNLELTKIGLSRNISVSSSHQVSGDVTSLETGVT